MTGPTAIPRCLEEYLCPRSAWLPAATSYYLNINQKVPSTKSSFPTLIPNDSFPHLTDHLEPIPSDLRIEDPELSRKSSIESLLDANIQHIFLAECSSLNDEPHHWCCSFNLFPFTGGIDNFFEIFQPFDKSLVGNRDFLLRFDFVRVRNCSVKCKNELRV